MSLQRDIIEAADIRGEHCCCCLCQLAAEGEAKIGSRGRRMAALIRWPRDFRAPIKHRLPRAAEDMKVKVISSFRASRHYISAAERAFLNTFSALITMTAGRFRLLPACLSLPPMR